MGSATMIGCRFSGCINAGGASTCDFVKCPPAGKRYPFPLTDVHVLAATTQFRTAGCDCDFLLLCFWIASNRCAAIRLQRGNCILERNLGLRSRNFPGACGEIHLAGADVHAYR